MFKNYFTLITFVIFAGIINNSLAQTKPLNVVTTAVPFLRIPSDARSSGMGDLGIATSPDANSTLWNTAKIPFAQNKGGLGVTFAPWLRGLGVRDVYLTSLAGYYKLDETQAISGSLKYFSLGDVQFTDDNGNNLNSFRPREYSFDAGYSRKLSDKLALGIAVRYIHSNLASGTFNGVSTKAASAVAADLSLFHDGTSGMTTSGLNWGVSLTNLGSKISYTNNATQKDFLPANLGAGLAYTKIINEETKITFGLDVNKLLVTTPPQLSGSSTSADSNAIVNYKSKGVLSTAFSSFNDGPGQISAGAELIFFDQFAFRAGYFYESPKKGDRKYFTIGAGLNYNKIGINFSYLVPTGTYAPINPFINTFRIGVVFNCDKK